MGPQAGGPEGSPRGQGDVPAVHRIGAFPRSALAVWLAGLIVVCSLGISGHLIDLDEAVPSTLPAPSTASPTRSAVPAPPPVPAFPAIAAGAPSTDGLVVAPRTAVVRAGPEDELQVRVRDIRELPAPTGTPRTVPRGLFLAVTVDYRAVHGAWVVGANDWRTTGIARLVHVRLDRLLAPSVSLRQGAVLSGTMVLEAPGAGELRLRYRPGTGLAQFDVRLRSGPRFTFHAAGTGIPAEVAVERAVASIPGHAGSIARVLVVSEGPRGWFVGQDGGDPEAWVWAVVVAGSFDQGALSEGPAREPHGAAEKTVLVLVDHATGAPALVTAPAW